MIEKDFLKVFSRVPADLYVNRITNYNPVTAENLKKMTNKITSVTENILPGERSRLHSLWLYIRNNCFRL